MSFSAFDHRCMATALQLANKGINTAHPNPRVGCVIAHNEQIVGQGWHEKAGKAHAEINALADAGDHAGVCASGATAYVTLEPCSHSGKTPPCTDALIAAKVSRVVCALQDPNPEVSGDGIKRLQQAGIEVQLGLMAAQAEEQNTGFLMRMRHGRPWVRVKLAQSMDGHIALANGSSQWISGPESRADVQRWRARSDAILTGVGTVLADDPSMNVRTHESAGENARQPLRVIADSHWRTPPDARMLGLAGKVLIAGLSAGDKPKALAASAAELINLPATDDRVDLLQLLQELGRREINEVQVEAGAILCGALMQQGLVDEVLIYQAPILLGGDAVSPFATPRLDKMDDRVHLKWMDSQRFGNDLRLRLRPVKQGL